MIILGEMGNDLKEEHLQLMENWSWVNLLKAASCWAQALDDYTAAKVSEIFEFGQIFGYLS